MIKKLSGKCPLCGGNKCGADWIEDAIASKLEEIVDNARQKHHTVEITTLSA